MEMGADVTELRGLPASAGLVRRHCSVFQELKAC